MGKNESADRLMIETAKKMVGKSGCTGLRIRELVEKAGVNLGLFHYHFKSKQRFTKIVLQEYYEDFFSRLTIASQEGEDGITQLRNSLLAVGLFFKSEHEFYLALLKDILNEEPQVIGFLRENMPRHMEILRGLVLRCQKEGSLAPLPIHQTMSFLMTSLNFPTLIGFVLQKRSRGAMTGELQDVISDKAIAQRIDIALKGLRP